MLVLSEDVVARLQEVKRILEARPRRADESYTWCDFTRSELTCLHDRCGVSNGQMASVMGLTRNAVLGQVQRYRPKLHQQYKEENRILLILERKAPEALEQLAGELGEPVDALLKERERVLGELDESEAA